MSLMDITYEADNLGAIAKEFRRRAQDLRNQANFTKVARVKAECNAGARAWDEAASILDRTTMKQPEAPA